MLAGPPIAPEQRTLAAMTHLSGLAGYLLPFGGILVPIIIWAVKSDSPLISTIAKQALLLNVLVYLLVGVSAILLLTILLIPLVILFWIALGIVAIALPIVGAVRSWDGNYYRYPWIGLHLP